MEARPPRNRTAREWEKAQAHAIPGAARAPERALTSLAGAGSYVRTRLYSADHGWKVLFKIYEMVFAEQDGRPAALTWLDHQDFVEVDQDFP